MPVPFDVKPEAAPSSPKRMPILLRRAWCGLNQGLRDRIEHLGITPYQFSMLRWLSESDPQGLSQRTLADLMASDPNTISSTLSRMEARGLVTRAKNEQDHRASLVRLGPAGAAKFEKARSIALALQDHMLAALPESRRAKFLEELDTIANACAGVLEKPPSKAPTLAPASVSMESSDSRRVAKSNRPSQRAGVLRAA